MSDFENTIEEVIRDIKKRYPDFDFSNMNAMLEDYKDMPEIARALANYTLFGTRDQKPKRTQEIIKAFRQDDFKELVHGFDEEIAKQMAVEFAANTYAFEPEDISYQKIIDAYSRKDFKKLMGSYEFSIAKKIIDNTASIARYHKEFIPLLFYLYSTKRFRKAMEIHKPKIAEKIADMQNARLRQSFFSSLSMLKLYSSDKFKELMDSCYEEEVHGMWDIFMYIDDCAKEAGTRNAKRLANLMHEYRLYKEVTWKLGEMLHTKQSMTARDLLNIYSSKEFKSLFEYYDVEKITGMISMIEDTQWRSDTGFHKDQYHTIWQKIKGLFRHTKGTMVAKALLDAFASRELKEIYEKHGKEVGGVVEHALSRAGQKKGINGIKETLQYSHSDKEFNALLQKNKKVASYLAQEYLHRGQEIIDAFKSEEFAKIIETFKSEVAESIVKKLGAVKLENDMFNRFNEHSPRALDLKNLVDFYLRNDVKNILETYDEKTAASIAAGLSPENKEIEKYYDCLVNIIIELKPEPETAAGIAYAFGYWINKSEENIKLMVDLLEKHKPDFSHILKIKAEAEEHAHEMQSGKSAGLYLAVKGYLRKDFKPFVYNEFLNSSEDIASTIVNEHDFLNQLTSETVCPIARILAHLGDEYTSRVKKQAEKPMLTEYLMQAYTIAKENKDSNTNENYLKSFYKGIRGVLDTNPDMLLKWAKTVKKDFEKKSKNGLFREVAA